METTSEFLSRWGMTLSAPSYSADDENPSPPPSEKIPLVPPVNSNSKKKHVMRWSMDFLNTWTLKQNMW